MIGEKKVLKECTKRNVKVSVFSPVVVTEMHRPEQTPLPLVMMFQGGSPGTSVTSGLGTEKWSP